MDTEVITAVTGEEDGFVAAELAAASGIVLRRRCADLAELLAAAEAGLGAVALISADMAWLDREVIQRLHVGGLTVLALVGEEPWQGERMLALGADAIVGKGAGIAAAVLTWAGQAPPAPAPPAAAPTPDPAWSQRDAAGRLIAVWGPAGAPGRTTVAINLAAELATRGMKVLLVDADTYGGAVAPALALLDEAPGLAAACRLATVGAVEPDRLIALAGAVSENWRVLTGISRASRWPELSTAALAQVWAVARQVADVVVVDTGFNLENDEALTYDTYAPQRNGATLSALQAADEVVMVGRADVVGLARLLALLAADEVDVLPPVRHLVINHVRPELGGKDVPAVADRYGGVKVEVLIPFDPAVAEALFRGVVLAEVKPGPALEAIRRLAALVVPGPSAAVAGTRRARRRG